jgi:signal transduction histidine kinase
VSAEISHPGRGDRTLSGFVAAAFVAVALVCAAYWLSLQQSRAAAWVSHTHEVLATIARTRAALVDIQNGHRGFTISGLEEDLRPYHSGRAAIAAETARLRALLADNPVQQQRLGDLERLLMSRLASAARLVAARRDGGFQASKAIVDTGLPTEEMANLRAALKSLEAEEERLLRERLADHEWRVRWFWAGTTAVVVLLLAGLALAYLQVRRDRAAHQALLESEHRFRLMTSSAEEELQRLNRSLEALVQERTAELRRTNADLLDAKLRLRDLSSQLISAQEQERRNIARDLDETGQSLTVIRMDLMQMLRGAAGATARIPDCIAVTDAAVAHIRAVVLNLRPTMLDDLGLVDALEWTLDQHARTAGWKATLEGGHIGEEVPAEIRTACFRIAQEALANAARHAQASEVKMHLKVEGGTLELTVSDNGAGFDVGHYRSAAERRKHFGLMTMEERAGLVGGSVDIDTSPGRGTRIRASLPLRVAAEPA